MAGVIKVDLTVNQTTGNPSESVQPKNEDKKKSESIAQNQSFNLGAGIAMGITGKAFNYAASHAGEWTGSSALQEQINLTQKLAGIGASFLINPYLGLANLGYTVATSTFDQSFKLNWENKAINELQRRSGNYLSNRSRQ